MKKQLIAGIILLAASAIMLIGAFRMLPDLKAMGVFATLFSSGFLVLICVYFKKIWNKAMYIGAGLLVAGIFSAFGSTSMLPDLRPVITMAVVAVIGLITFIAGFRKGVKNNQEIEKGSVYMILYWVVTVLLFGISAVLLPMIDWQIPKDPAAVMILSFLLALCLVYSAVRKHQNQKQVFYAGIIFVINFPLVKAYEEGWFDFIGGFYRIFIPLYEKFDFAAEKIEWGLIILTLILSVFFIAKKYRVGDMGNKSLAYFILLPVMAIFLFEMMGLPAGFLAGTTTRSDLLVTDTNAVMSTFGMVFIGAVAYALFVLFPFWVAILFAGCWWVFWKPWLLHHPDPALFKDFKSFFPAAVFLFFTGIKRIVLPMILLFFSGISRKK